MPRCGYIVQVHTWVTAMALKGKRFAPWSTNETHPALPSATRSSKRLKGSFQGASRAPSGTPSTSKKTPKDAGASQKHKTRTLAMHADATLRGEMVCSEQTHADGMVQAVAQFVVDHVHGVVAVGSTGPVYCARYCPQSLSNVP